MPKADWKYPLFISYSHNDEDIVAYAGAIKALFNQMLGPMLRNRGFETLPHDTMFRDVDDLATTGNLEAELRDAVSVSFALMIVVGPGYVSSRWCLKELSRFMECFAGQNEELSRRLFIVCTDKNSEEALLSSGNWPKQLLSASIRSQFYFRDTPIPIRSVLRDGNSPGGAVPNPDFESKTQQLVTRLANLIQDSAPYPRRCSSIPSSRRVLLGPVTDDLESAAADLTKVLTGLSIEVETLAITDIVKSGARDTLGARARNCALFIQPYREGPPLLDFPVGGHLAVMREFLSNVTRTWWWRVPESVPAQKVSTRSTSFHQPFFDEIRSSAKTKCPAELAAELRTLLQPPDGRKCAVVFIESSVEQQSEWEKIRDEVERAWLEEAPDLPLRCPGLPFAGKDTLEPVGESHGVVLLYANVAYNTLYGRAKAVEEMLFETGNKPVRFVAWLPKDDPKVPHEDYVWKTVAFRGRGQPISTTIEPEALRTLLRKVKQKAANQ